MILLSSLWGFQQVAIKLAAPGISLVMQGAIRSGIACVLVMAWARCARHCAPGSATARWLRARSPACCSPANSR